MLLNHSDCSSCPPREKSYSPLRSSKTQASGHSERSEESQRRGNAQLRETILCTSLLRFAHILLLALLLTPLSALAGSTPFIPRHGISFATGNFFTQHSDLDLAGMGGGLRWIRSYNSQNPDRSILGYGWSFTANNRLELGGATPVYKRADGRIFRFTSAGANTWAPNFDSFYGTN